MLSNYGREDLLIDLERMVFIEQFRTIILHRRRNSLGDICIQKEAFHFENTIRPEAGRGRHGEVP